MKEQRNTSSVDPATENVGRKKRTKKPPLWSRIIYDDAMVALVRLLGHEGLPFGEMRLKAKPLVEKFGRERLQAVTDEIVDNVGDGDDAIVRLTEQARKLAIQLIGRPKVVNTVESSGSVCTAPPSSVLRQPEATSPIVEFPSARMPGEPVPSASTASSSADPMTSAERVVATSRSPAGEQTEDDAQDWTNYETSCVAAFLGQDREFTDECLHLAKTCCERAAHCESVSAGVQTESQVRTQLLAAQLQRLVCEHNPLAGEDVSPFAELLEAAITQVDWQQLAESFLQRSADSSDAN